MTTFNTASLKALFSYPFRQPNWQSKLLVLGLLSAAGFIIPVIPWLFVAGYVAEIMRRQALEGGEPELPEWDDWGRLIVDGLRLSVIGFVLSLPAMIVFVVGFGMYFASTFPLMLSEGNEESLLPLMFVGMMVMMISMFLGTLITMVTGVVSPVALTHVAVKRKFSAVFELREWWKVLWANLGGYVLALVILYSISYILMTLGYMLAWTMICCVLTPVFYFVACPYLSVITGVVFGQVYREGQLKRAESTGSELETTAEPTTTDAE